MHTKHLIAALLALAAGACQAHARLAASEPKAASTLDAPPKQLRLQFNEPLEPAFSKLELRDAANREVKLPGAAAGKARPNEMAVALPPLPAGEYRVLWSTVTHDGHRTKGEFTFRIR